MKEKNKIAFGRLDLLRNDTLKNKKIRIGFIGGGPNSFIGYTHRLSARFDNRFEFVAGVFSKDKNGKPIISYIDQFPEPKNMDQGLFLQKLSDALEESKNKISFPLPVGSTIFSNNYFWLHGRKAFKEHSGLSRELLRIRGTFFH